MGCPVPSVAPIAGSIAAYTFPSIYNSSTLFNLNVGSTDIPVMQFYEYDYAHFSMDSKPTWIAITIPDDTDLTNVRISPKKLGITPTKSTGCVSFTIPSDEYLIVQIGNLKELVIAADKLETNKPVKSASYVYNILSKPFNADPTGSELSTTALQSAIDTAAADWAAAKSNGVSGLPARVTVYVPKGLYLIGNIVLKSNTELYLEAGSFLRFTGVKSDYTLHWYKSSQGRDVTWWIRTDFNSTNIKVYGRGTLDGNGKYGTNVGKINNNILVPIATSHFMVDGIVIKESSSWSTIPMRSQNLLFQNIKWFNSLWMSENDGIDVLESVDVVVRHTIAISLDDPYSTKAYTKIFPKYNDVLPAARAVQNVLFDDNLSWTRCFAFKIGQGVQMPHLNITFQNGVVYDAAVGLGIHHAWGTSYIKDVTFKLMQVERITMELEGRSTWLGFIITDKPDGTPAASDGAGPVSKIRVRDTTVWSKGKTGISLEGLSPTANISSIFWSHTKMPGVDGYAQSLEALNSKTEPTYVYDIKWDTD
ncbi:uncharacterized protein H6S33_000705 [Morchella sextelata]|uniref:uncharacterized protein n=1 Tax=Morchella sextelata TaxID=1174677 RepID=UPI001D042E49|nr:uncharacterized protein H6S33_000705 [Morchella sextelata]KAH0615069.1 hypothetical protein H6S33_000705 [Morchella sextelata]